MKSNLKTHVRLKHEEIFENTDFSKIPFIDSKDQKDSNLKDIDKSMRNFKCEICNKTFQQNWRLKRHEKQKHGLEVHDEKISYQCPFCDTKIKLEHNLKIHIEYKHKGAVEPIKDHGKLVHEKKKHGKNNMRNVNNSSNCEEKNINIGHCNKMPVEKYKNSIKNMGTVHEDQNSKAVHENQNSKSSETLIGIQDATIDSTC